MRSGSCQGSRLGPATFVNYFLAIDSFVLTSASGCKDEAQPPHSVGPYLLNEQLNNAKARNKQVREVIRYTGDLSEELDGWGVKNFPRPECRLADCRLPSAKLQAISYTGHCSLLSASPTMHSMRNYGLVINPRQRGLAKKEQLLSLEDDGQNLEKKAISGNRKFKSSAWNCQIKAKSGPRPRPHIPTHMPAI